MPKVRKEQWYTFPLDFSPFFSCILVHFHFGIYTLIGHCYEREEPCPYLPFAEILEMALSQAPSLQEFRQWLGDTAAELALILPRLRRLFPDILPPPELAPQQLQCSLFQSLTECLARVSRQTPLFLILDDLQ